MTAESDIQSVCAVLVTCGRAAWLERCIRSLLVASRRQPDIHFRISAVVNGNDPESVSRLQKLDQEFPGILRPVLVLPESLTPGDARNRALETIDSRWVYFIDDDAFVEPDLFERFRKTLIEIPKAEVVGGPNLTPPDSGLFEDAAGRALSSRFATFTSVERYRSRGMVRPCGESDLILCNLFVRRASIPSLTFLPSLICAEETWMLQNIARAGGLMVYDPALSVWHERRDQIIALFRQTFTYGVGRGQVIVRRPSTLRVAHVLPSFAVALGILATIGFPAFKIFFVPLLVIYVVLCLAFSAMVNRGELSRLSRFLATAMVFPLIHIGYGLGVWRGLLK